MIEPSILGLLRYGVKNAVEIASAKMGHDRSRHQLADLFPRASRDGRAHLGARYLRQERGSGFGSADARSRQNDGRGKLGDLGKPVPARRFRQDVGANGQSKRPVGARRREVLQRPQRATLAADLLLTRETATLA